MLSAALFISHAKSSVSSMSTRAYCRDFSLTLACPFHTIPWPTTHSASFASRAIQNTLAGEPSRSSRVYNSNSTGTVSMEEHAATTVKPSPACIAGTRFPNPLRVQNGVNAWTIQIHLDVALASALAMKTEATAHPATASQMRCGAAAPVL
jgi:hypothetical protein